MSIGAVEDPLAEEMRAEPGATPGAANLDLALGAAGPAEGGDPADLIAPPPGSTASTPPIDAIVPPPEFGPPVPQPATDGILANLPPPGAAGAPGAGTKVTPEGMIEKQDALGLQDAEEARRKADADHIAAIDHQADVQDALDHGNSLMASRQKTYDDALAKYEKMKPVDYFDPSRHSKWAAGLEIAFGGIGAGLSAAGGGSSENRVLAMINKEVDDDYAHQRAQIEKARDSVVMAKTGIQDAREAKAAMLEDVSAKRVATLTTLETEARQKLAERGIPAAQIDADQRVLALQAARVKAAREADEQKRKDAMAAAQIKYLEARAGKLGRGAGGGGAGRGAAYDDFHAAVVAGKTDELGALAARAGIKPNQIADQVSKIRLEPSREAKGAKGAGAASGGDEKLAIRDPNTGEVRGYAPSARNVAAFNTRAINYDQAIKSLEEIKASGDWLPRGAKFDNAVLAIASTTTAGSTDANVRHEAGTLKNSFGLLSDEAITNKIADLKNRQAQFYKTLTPAGGGGEKPTPGSASDPMMIKAKKAMSDPNAPSQAKAAAALYMREHGDITL